MRTVFRSETPHLTVYTDGAGIDHPLDGLPIVIDGPLPGDHRFMSATFPTLGISEYPVKPSEISQEA